MASTVAVNPTRDLYLLIGGNAVSAAGNSVYLIAVTLLLKEMTGSAFMLGFFQFLALAPGFLLSPVTGVIVDRMSRRTIIVVSDLLRGVLMVLAGVALTVPWLRTAPLVLVVAFLGGVGHAIFVPAVHALLPVIVPPGRLQSATGLRAASSQLSGLAGNAAGGALFTVLGGPVLFVLNGITFFLSAVQELFIRGGREPVGRDSNQSMIAMAREGFQAVIRDRPLQSLMLSQGGLFLISPFLVVALPFLVMDELGLSEAAVGMYLAAALAGGIAAFSVLRRVNRETLLTAAFHGYAYLGLGFAFAGVAIAPGPAVLLAVAVISGAAAGTVYLVTISWIQTRRAPRLHGRLYAILEAGNSALAPAGYLVAGILLELTGSRSRPLIFAAVAAAAVIWGVTVVGNRRRYFPYRITEDE